MGKGSREHRDRERGRRGAVETEAFESEVFEIAASARDALFQRFTETHTVCGGAAVVERVEGLGTIYARCAGCRTLGREEARDDGTLHRESLRLLQGCEVASGGRCPVCLMAGHATECALERHLARLRERVREGEG